MRRFIPILIICVMLSSVATAAFAQDDDEKGRVWYIKGSFGMAGQDLGELEKALKDQKQNWIDYGVDVSTYAKDFDTVWDYRVEVGTVLFKNFTLGLAFSYQPRSDDQQISGVAPQDQIRTAEELKINYYGILGVFQYWIPGNHGFFFGVNGGYGAGKYEQTITAQSTAVPEWNLTADGKYDGSNFVYGFSGGYQYEFLNGFLLYLELGYEFRDLGTFDGKTTSTDTDIVPESSGTYNVNGEDVNFDFSGPFLAIGFGFTGPY